MIFQKIWISIIGIFFTLIFSVLILLVGFFDKNKKYTAILSKYWARSILFFSFIKYNVIGINNIIKSNNYVLVSNHQSGFDILVTFASLDIPISFFTKKELFYIPLFGWALKAAGMVYVDRFNKDKSKLSINDGLEKITNTFLSILVYPEATRTNYNELGEFKKGAFILSVESQKPIIPLTVLYKHDPKKIINYQITLLVGNQIDSLNYNIEQKDILLVKVKEVIQSNINSYLEN